MLSSVQKRLIFNFLPGVGASVYWKCVEHFGSIELAFDHNFDVLKKLVNPDAVVLLNELENTLESSRVYQLVLREQEVADASGVSLVCDNDLAYPALLRETKRCPSVLYVRGNVDILSFPQIAMVGSRSPSPIGQELAFEFAKQLADAGFSITSGLALGIDAAAHRGALSSEASVPSSTVAVLGSGLNNVYPKRNRRLADDIIANGGALLSEFVMDAQALPQHFPQRNRIVSGLACGTLVVEAALKSGSLITARCALQQDREVFAIPGSIRSVVSRGCNAMIKSGAKLVETPMDVICELESLVQFQRDSVKPLNDRVESTQPESAHGVLLESVGFEPTSLDVISERALLPIEQLLPALLHLELEGRIENTGLGYIRL